MYAHGTSSHISQPPHSTGKAFQGLRARIDPEHIPSAVEVAEYDAEVWAGKPYMTLPGEHVPLATTDFLSIDQGNSSPRFVRASTWHIPFSSSLAETCQIPVAAIIQPFADALPEEEPVPVVNFSENGPPRCAECRAYVNPWCTWISGGSKWRCNLCGHHTDVMPDYFCSLDQNQLRLDHLQRPELMKGTVDFVVGPEYYAPYPTPRIVPSYVSPEPLPTSTPTSPSFLSTSKSPSFLSSAPTSPSFLSVSNTAASFLSTSTSTFSSAPVAPQAGRVPEPMRILFVIDVSREAISCGLVRAACQAIQGVLYGGELDDGTRMEPCVPVGQSIGIVTYDTSIHFYDLSPTRNAAIMMVVPDIEEEMYCPLQDSVMFVDPHASRNIIEPLLADIPNRFTSSPTHLCAVGAAMRSSLAALARRGGQVVLFQSSLCSLGPGVAETPLDEAKLYDTDKERQLFVPRSELWRDLGDEFAEAGVGVSMLVGTGMTGYVGFSSIGLFCSLTGGDVRLFPRFEPQRDSLQLVSFLTRILTRQTGYSCQTRVRVSKGLKCNEFFGTFSESPTAMGTLAMGTMHSDSAFAVSLKHTGGRGSPLSSREYAHLQCAVLYTSKEGERRVRVLNVAFQVATLAGNVFRFADAETTLTFLAKETVSSTTKHTLSNLRDMLTERCSSILLAYRRECAAATAPSQLILPEAFKLLPLYTLALHKHRTLRAYNVPSDIRNYYAYRLLSMSVRQTLNHLYPRFMALHDLTDTIALPPSQEESSGVASTDGNVEKKRTFQLPSLMRDTFMQMHADGVYLIDNDEIMVLWIGSSVSPQILMDLFGVESSHDVDPSLSTLPTLPTRLSAQVRNIITHRTAERGGVSIRLMIARQNLDGSELELSDMLVEDSNCGAMSYIDHLCHIHKQITYALTNNTTIESINSYGLRQTPW